jgi:hypothetical protein
VTRGLLAVNRQWAVDGGGVVLVGWVVIKVVGLLTVNTTTTTLSLSSSYLVGLRCMVTTSLTATWSSSLVGSFVALGRGVRR